MTTQPIRRAALRATPFANPALVCLGKDDEGNSINLETRLRLEHMQVIGATRSGKSTFLEYLIKQDLLKGHGMVVMDPHGGHADSLFHKTLDFIREHRPRLLTQGKVFILSPNVPGQVVGFNPLAPLPGAKISVISDTLLSAFERVWGGEDTHEKPQIRTVLKATFMALAELGMNLTDAKLFYDPADRHGVRTRIIDKLQNDYSRGELDRLDEMAKDKSLRREFQMSVMGPINRLNDFLSSDALSAMFAMNSEFGDGPAKTIDILDIMEKGHVLLVDLQPATEISEADAKLLGTILLRYISFLAKLRRHYKPFFVHVDECHLYMTDDIPELLPQMAKYGVGFTLAHQWLSQLGKPSEKIYDAVQKSTLTKVIFRLADQREAEELAYSAIPINLLEPKDLRPTQVGIEEVALKSGNTNTGTSVGTSDSLGRTIARGRNLMHSENWSEMENWSSSDMVGSARSSGLIAGSGVGASSTASHIDATSMQFDPATGSVISVPIMTGQGISAGDTTALGNFTTANRALSEQLSDNQAHVDTSGGALSRGGAIAVGESEAVAKSNQHTDSVSVTNSQGQGWHQAHRPVYKDLPGPYFSKEEQAYRNGLLLRTLPTGRAAFSLRAQHVWLNVPDITKPKR